MPPGHIWSSQSLQELQVINDLLHLLPDCCRLVRDTGRVFLQLVQGAGKRGEGVGFEVC